MVRRQTSHAGSADLSGERAAMAQEIVRSLLSQLATAGVTDSSSRVLFPNGIELVSFDVAVGGELGAHLKLIVAGKDGVPGAVSERVHVPLSTPGLGSPAANRIGPGLGTVP